MSIEISEEMVEAAAEAIAGYAWLIPAIPVAEREQWRQTARAALTAALPLIEEWVREACAKTAERHQEMREMRLGVYEREPITGHLSDFVKRGGAELHGLLPVDSTKLWSETIFRRTAQFVLREMLAELGWQHGQPGELTRAHLCGYASEARESRRKLMVYFVEFFAAAHGIVIEGE